MDKLFFAVYGVLICLGIIFITALQYTGLNQNGMIIVCMVGAGILSITSINVINVDNKMITLAHIGRIIGINQIIKRTVNATANNL